ncbi:hypothetical protein CEXT_202501 [Caerostris extrusa]|uniref:Uncharacterized protein n=1 Tax=Caerostris extrusa TaxID=172846 RepID=A0AAV4X5L0_CAEEX|nr:hypothetical protein CEXT_202501 [Caerostris extrusa]
MPTHLSCETNQTSAERSLSELTNGCSIHKISKSRRQLFSDDYKRVIKETEMEFCTKEEIEVQTSYMSFTSRITAFMRQYSLEPNSSETSGKAFRTERFGGLTPGSRFLPREKWIQILE